MSLLTFFFYTTLETSNSEVSSIMVSDTLKIESSTQAESCGCLPWKLSRSLRGWFSIVPYHESSLTESTRSPLIEILLCNVASSFADRGDTLIKSTLCYLPAYYLPLFFISVGLD